MTSCGIYKIQNLINNKVYIGQSVDIDYRFSNHKSESFNPKSNAYNTAIHRAIRKYGIDNFSFEIIELCNVDELNDKEIYWIKKYDSYGKGYNMTHGGEGVPSIDRQYIYDLWDQGMSIGEIYNHTKHNKHSIIEILRKYENYNSKESQKRGRNKASISKSRQVEQYDINGIFIAEYNSAKLASKELNIKASSILAVIRGEQLTAGGFQWILKGQNPPGLCNAKGNNIKRSVVQLDKVTLEFISEYESMSSATKSVKLKNSSSIMFCCQGKTKTAGGFCWMFSEDYYKNILQYTNPDINEAQRN